MRHRSSAKAKTARRSAWGVVHPHGEEFKALMSGSKKARNRIGERESPCLMPLVGMNGIE
jgi:uncharacterized Rossmann fold enzyme